MSSQPHSKRSDSRGGRGGTRGPLPRSIQISKKLSWLLRHGAEKENLPLDSAGYANVSQVLQNRNLRSLKVTFDEIRECVEGNEKKRFSLIPIPITTKIISEGGGDGGGAAENDPANYLIRANQGHSLVKIETERLLKPFVITSEDSLSQQQPQQQQNQQQKDVTTVIHGTNHPAWRLILESGGLKSMGRNHVHFATGLPEGFSKQSVIENDDDDEESPRGGNNAEPVISGMRKSSTILIFLDIEKAMEAGVKFWVSDNGVVLSEGDENGLLSVEFFKRVEDRTKGGRILMRDGKLL